MSFKTKNFEQSSVMKEMERLYIEKNPSEIKKEASKKEIGEDFISQAISLSKDLRLKGFSKQADSLDEKIAFYSIEDVELKKMAGKDGGEILLDFAHENDDSEIAEAKENFGKILDPVAKHKLIVDTVMKEVKKASKEKTILDEAHDGDVEVAPAKDGLGVVETLQSAHNKILEIALKSAKGDKKAKAQLEEIGELLKKADGPLADWLSPKGPDKPSSALVTKELMGGEEKIIKDLQDKISFYEKKIKNLSESTLFMGDKEREINNYKEVINNLKKQLNSILEKLKNEALDLTKINQPKEDWNWWKRNVAGKVQRLSKDLKSLGKDNIIVELSQMAVVLLQSESWEEAKKELSGIDAQYLTLNSIKDLDNIVMRWENWVKKNKTASFKSSLNKFAQSFLSGPEGETKPSASTTKINQPVSKNINQTKTQKVKFEQYRDFVESMRAKPENTAWMDSVSKMQEFLSSFGNSIRKDYPQVAQKLYGTSIAGSNAIPFDGLWGTYTNKAIDAFNEFAKNTGVVLEKQNPFNILTLDDKVRSENISAANNNIKKIQEAAQKLNVSLSKPKQESEVKSEYLLNVPSDDFTKLINISEFKQDSALSSPIKESDLNSFKSLQDFVVKNGTTPKQSTVDPEKSGFSIPEWKQILNNFRALSFKEKNRKLLDKINELKEKLNSFSKYIISTLDDQSYSMKDIFPGSFIDSATIKSEKVELQEEIPFKNNPNLRDAFYRYENVSNKNLNEQYDLSQGSSLKSLEKSFWLPLSNPRIIPVNSLNKLNGRENFNQQIMYNNLLQSRNAPVSIIRNILNPRFIAQVNAGSVGANANLAQQTINHIEYLRTALTNQINEARNGETGWSENEINRSENFVQQWNNLFNTCIFALQSYIKNNS